MASGEEGEGAGWATQRGGGQEEGQGQRGRRAERTNTKGASERDRRPAHLSATGKMDHTKVTTQQQSFIRQYDTRDTIEWAQSKMDPFLRESPRSPIQLTARTNKHINRSGKETIEWSKVCLWKMCIERMPMFCRDLNVRAEKFLAFSLQRIEREAQCDAWSTCPATRSLGQLSVGSAVCGFSDPIGWSLLTTNSAGHDRLGCRLSASQAGWLTD